MREVHLPPSDKRTTVPVPVHHPDRGKAPVPLDIAVGERLRIGATHWERRLFNGSIVTVEALERRKQDSGGIRVLITGRTETGREVRFHHDEIRDYHGRIRLEHGYALTIASAQGLTADRVFLYADAKPARQTLYPAATRHRERLDFYLDRRPLVLEVADDVILAHLGSRWSRGAPKAAALDYPALPPQLHPAARLEGGEAALRPRPAVALDRSITRAARAFRAATLEFRQGNTALAVPDAREVWRVAQARHEAQAQRVAEAQREIQARYEAQVQREAEAEREAQVQREAEAQRKAEAERETQARQDLNAALSPHTEALCRRYFPHGVKQNGHWRTRIIHGQNYYSINVPLSGAAQGRWKLEATSKTGTLMRSLISKKAGPVRPIQLFGHGHDLWKDKLAGKPGDLLDIVLIREHCRTTAEAIAAGRAFLEGEIKARLEGKHEAQRQLNTELAPHAEALCRRYLARGVKQDGQWRVRTVQGENEYSMTVELEGPERGTWKNEATGEQGQPVRYRPRQRRQAQRHHRNDGGGARLSPWRT